MLTLSALVKSLDSRQLHLQENGRTMTIKVASGSNSLLLLIMTAPFAAHEGTVHCSNTTIVQCLQAVLYM